LWLSKSLAVGTLSSPCSASRRAHYGLLTATTKLTVAALSTNGGIVGVAAAIANVVYHATGRRVRDLPITAEKLI
jgi:hypothetical protein